MTGQTSHSPAYARQTGPASQLAPALAVVAGIGIFSVMDAAVKSASIVMGVYTALLLRNVLATVFSLPLWLASRQPLPRRRILRLHAWRAGIITIMALLFFYGLLHIPMAEAIAISFVAPIVALFLAALLLGEVIRPRAIVASLFGIAGVVTIGSGRLGGFEQSPGSLTGILALLGSALFYAYNLILQRQQALLAAPAEIALFQNLFSTLFVALPAPWLATLPGASGWGMVAAAGLLATCAHLCFSWAYARAETQVLLPLEYSAFPWAALMGWLFFRENVTLTTMAGAALIVAGCWIGTRNNISQPPS